MDENCIFLCKIMVMCVYWLWSKCIVCRNYSVRVTGLGFTFLYCFDRVDGAVCIYWHDGNWWVLKIYTGYLMCCIMLKLRCVQKLEQINTLFGTYIAFPPKHPYCCDIIYSKKSTALFNYDPSIFLNTYNVNIKLSIV